MSSAETQAALMTAGSVVAAGMIVGGVAAAERRRYAAQDGQTVLALTFPSGAEAAGGAAALRALSGMTGTMIVLEVRAESESVQHLIHVAEDEVASVRAQLEAGVPGLRVSPHKPKPLSASATHGRRVAVSGRVVLDASNAEAANRSVLAAASHLGVGEFVVLRWALRPGRPASGDSLASVLWHGYKNRPAPPAPWLAKTDGPGFAVAGTIVAGASTAARAGSIAAGMTSVIRSRRTGTGTPTFRRFRGPMSDLPRVGPRSGWLSVGEILPLTGWPVGLDAVEGVAMGAARQMRAGRDVPKDGRRLFTALGSEGLRPVALGDDAMRRHTALLGSTGSGKSTVMISAVLSDMRRGLGGCIFDPKGDLIIDILARIRPEDLHRIALVDPSSEDGFAGFDLLGGGDPDLRADVVLGALKRIFGDSWGVRTDTYLGMGLRLIAEDRGASLIDWPRVYSDASYRHRLVSRITDPVQRSAWNAYEALSAAEQTTYVAPAMGKILSMISRPRLRAVIAQPQPKLDIERHLESGGWMLVSLAPGPIGEPAAQFLGALATYGVWSAVEARAAIPREKRRTLGIYLDELSSLNDLPFGIEPLFERARGLGGAITVAVQALSRVPEQTRASLLGNAATLVCFRSGADEAARIAREMPGLTAKDLMGLGKFEVAARVSLGGGGATRVITGMTEPMPDATDIAGKVRAASSAQFGRSLDEIDRMIRERYGEPEMDAAEPVQSGRRRRQS